MSSERSRVTRSRVMKSIIRRSMVIGNVSLRSRKSMAIFKVAEGQGSLGRSCTCRAETSQMYCSVVSGNEFNLPGCPQPRDSVLMR